jgi:hypothetical protein
VAPLLVSPATSLAKGLVMPSETPSKSMTKISDGMVCDNPEVNEFVASITGQRIEVSGGMFV